MEEELGVGYWQFSKRARCRNMIWRPAIAAIAWSQSHDETGLTPGFLLTLHEGPDTVLPTMEDLDPFP